MSKERWDSATKSWTKLSEMKVMGLRGSIQQPRHSTSTINFWNKIMNEKHCTCYRCTGQKRGRMKHYLPVILFAAFLLNSVVASAQVFTPDLGDPIFWDANIETDVDEYRMYRSTIPCTDATPTPLTCAGFAQVATIPQGSDPMDWVEPGPVVFVQDYYYRVLARNTSLVDSPFSNELNVRWFNPNAPSAPGDLRGTQQGVNMRLHWADPDPREHVSVWNVYKSTQEEFQGAVLAHVSVTNFHDVNENYVDRRYYNVTAVNDGGIESMSAGPAVYVGNRGRGSNR